MTDAHDDSTTHDTASDSTLTPGQAELARKLEQNPKIAALVKSVDEEKTKLAGSGRAAAAADQAGQDAQQHGKDEQELAPGNPRSLEQMEQLNPREEGEDPVAYLDRIFG